MRIIAIFTIILQVSLFFISCEKDYYEEDCKPSQRGGDIGGWEEPKDTTVKENKDTMTNGFFIQLNEWGDTINKDIII